ncbi:TetR family transcriptional regulator [Lottiidibacillus patelloidae]|uniref:TetR family transcriptional regulator n=1 Tax=Lottiidibacillus patelloidae TaxID=2670334 RepID=A0A263BV65_9BACI|nr:TetR/AcrR family transcriptional regulator [Lottiidibacillus patelloidae]OZM57056.1 TetR family transcriptional regulator [Lottiidibacillus patelloidae]
MSSKKNDIICKVAEIIHSNGYANTKLSDILKETGIGKGQFYHYFQSKQDLSLAVIDYLISEMEKALFTNVLDKDFPPKEKLNLMLDEIYKMQEIGEGKNGCPIGNLAVEISEEEAMFRDKVASFFDLWEKKVQEVLDNMYRNGELRMKIDTKKQARSIIAMIEGAILRVKNSHDIQVFRDTIDVIKFQYRLLENGEINEKNTIHLL